MKNWKTTLAGALTAAGSGMVIVEDPTVKMIGQILVVIGAMLLGIFSKDANVTGGTVVQPSTQETKSALLNPQATEVSIEGEKK